MNSRYYRHHCLFEGLPSVKLGAIGFREAVLEVSPSANQNGALSALSETGHSQAKLQRAALSQIKPFPFGN